MSHYQLRTADREIGVLASSEADALERAVDAELLYDGDEGSIEEVADEQVEPFEPEGPG